MKEEKQLLIEIFMKNVALHILDLAENSVRAKARMVQVTIKEDPGNDLYLLSVEDDGEGMDEEEKAKATDPFYTSRSTRKVGLGLPLIKQNAERTGGSFALFSEPGKGTKLEAKFVMSHPDRLPLGEIDEVLVLLAVSSPQMHLVYKHETMKGSYLFDTEIIKEIIGDFQDINMEIRNFLREMIIENLKEIKAEP